MLITNLPEHGGPLNKVFFDSFRAPETERLRMVSGYVGKEMVSQLRKEIQKRHDIAVEMVVGMAAKEGLHQASYDMLLALNEELRERKHPKFDRQGVYVFFSGKDGDRSRGMHAKAYLFDKGLNRQLIVGSSNFSYSGLEPGGNIEMNVVDTSTSLANEYAAFFEDLHINELAVPIDKVDDFPIRGKAKFKRVNTQSTLVKGKKPTDFKQYRYVDIDLARNIENQPKSNLNACFGKGRWNRSTGKVILREWYEVEIMASSEVTSLEIYPKGNFQVVTSDGYQFESKTSGNNYKNLRSAGELTILGIWIKGCLEDAGSLTDDPQELVTRETFEDYGNSILRMYLPSKGNAIFHFPQDPADL